MAKKYEVVKSGIFGAKGAVEVGTKFSIKGELPASWKDKVKELGSTDDKEMATGAASGPDADKGPAGTVDAKDAQGVAKAEPAKVEPPKAEPAKAEPPKA